MCFALLFILGKFESVVQGYQLMGGAVLVAACSMGFIRAGDLRDFKKMEVEMTIHENDDEESQESDDIEMAEPSRPYSPPVAKMDV